MEPLAVTGIKPHTSDSTAAPHISHSDARALFAGPGEMRALCRSFDWTTTSLGPVDHWDFALRTTATLVLGAPTAMVLLWGRDHIQLYNDAYRDLLGPRHAGDIGRPNRRYWPETWGDTRAICNSVLYEGKTCTLTDQRLVTMRDGVPVESFVTIAFGPVADDSGMIAGVLATVFETTDEVRTNDALAIAHARIARDRRETEAALLDRERRIRAIYDGTYEYIGLLSPDGTLLDCNRASLEFAGNRREDVIGKPFWETPWFTGTPGVPLALRAAIVRAAGGEFQRTTLPLARPSGEVVNFDFSLFPVRDEAGKVIFIVPEGRNITEEVRARRDAERALAESERARADAECARAEAEAANRAKGDFLAVMSHELRTPLNAIGGYAELMDMGLRGPVTEEQRADLVRIKQSQRHLLGLINQVLNYTRVGAGTVQYDLTDVSVPDALAAAEALIVPQARARGLAYEVEDCSPDILVRADRDKLQQILLNLLSNAIKFTEPHGSVRVSCLARNAVVEIAVADTGIGIAAGKLAEIFEPFVQVDAKLTRAQEGVGLGLAISQALARGMGGDLRATSTVGEGSVFALLLPRV